MVAEIALGLLRSRDEVLGLLDRLPSLALPEPGEVARGIGYVDAALVASCLLAPGTQLWTQDRRLDAVAAEIGLAPAG